MKQNDIKTKTLMEQTGELIDAGRYKDAMTLLRRSLGITPIPGLLGKLNQTESTYKYLLQFFTRGAEDPGRESLLGDIRRDLLGIADRIEREIMASDSSESYFSTLRMQRLRPVDLDAILASVIADRSMAELALSSGSYPLPVMTRLEEEEGKIFDFIWVADDISADTYRRLTDRIVSSEIPESTASLIVAAAGLGLLKFFDRNALMMLCEVAQMSCCKLAARACVNLVLALNRWIKFVADDSRLVQRLEALVEVDGMPRKLRTVVFNLIKTRDTDRVSKKMQKEVIPGLMQFGPDIIKRMKDQLKESSFSDIEGNPEWEELLKNSGLEDKLRELTEMQSDGADVMMAAFSNLKGFPFFRQLRNWMLPFSLHHSTLVSLRSIDDNSVAALLEMNGMMCDSDKYSFAFSLAGMPEMQRKMVLGQMEGQMDQMREQMKELELLKAGHEFEDEVLRYCRDLYRFYKLYPKRSEFYDPFLNFVAFSEIPVIGRLFENDKDIASMAEFYFKRGYYGDALSLLFRLSEIASDAPHVWEKIGFSLEKTQASDSEAVEAYMKAQLFNPDSKWISRRLGLCYRRMGDWRNAVEYLRMSMPEDGAFDRRMSLMIADTLMSGEKWNEALRELYRVDYESPGEAGVLRRMASCAFRSGDLGKALEWLDSIPEVERSEEDHRLRGHIFFVRRDIAGAIANYRRTVRPNDRRRLWKTNILSDFVILEKMGASRSDLLLLLESIAYSIE